MRLPGNPVIDAASTIAGTGSPRDGSLGAVGTSVVVVAVSPAGNVVFPMTFGVVASGPTVIAGGLLRAMRPAPATRAMIAVASATARSPRNVML